MEKDHIGNHVSYYNNGDLIIIGAGLPHFGFTDSLTGNKSEVVIQAKEDFLGNSFFDIPEMQQIKQLLHRSKHGIVFHEAVKKKVGPQIEALLELPSFEQLLSFLNILSQLAQTDDYTLLNVEKVILESKPQDTKRHGYSILVCEPGVHTPNSIIGNCGYGEYDGTGL